MFDNRICLTKTKNDETCLVAHGNQILIMACTFFKDRFLLPKCSVTDYLCFKCELPLLFQLDTFGMDGVELTKRLSNRGQEFKSDVLLYPN